MEIIQQINELIENNKSLKEENEKLKAKHDKFQCAKCKGHHTGCANPTCDSCVEELKEENRIHADILDEKDEEIKKLTKDNQILDIKLAQKTNEVDTHQSRLSDDMNGLRNKLANREKQIEELKGQITIKPNHMVAKDNEIAVLKVKIKKLEESSSTTYIDEFMKSINQSGYVKHGIMIGRYNNGKAKRKSVWVPEEVAKYLDEYPQVNKIAARGDVIA